MKGQVERIISAYHCSAIHYAYPPSIYMALSKYTWPKITYTRNKWGVSEQDEKPIKNGPNPQDSLISEMRLLAAERNEPKPSEVKLSLSLISLYILLLQIRLVSNRAWADERTFCFVFFGLTTLVSFGCLKVDYIRSLYPIISSCHVSIYKARLCKQISTSKQQGLSIQGLQRRLKEKMSE